MIVELQVNSIIDDNSKPTRATPSSFCDSPLSQYSVNIIPQDQIDDEPPVWNQSILATPDICVSTTPNSSQHFLTMNSPMLSSKLASLEIKMCGKMMAITLFL